MEENLKTVKCPYCDEVFKTYKGLCRHIFNKKVHGDTITHEQLLTDYMYNGIRPTCKCGCGEYTTMIYTGGLHFADYVMGHHNRVHNNWGHNPKAKEHSAETRRKQYASGERVQWNKGKKWEETYTEEEIENLREQYKNPNRNKKISEAFKGKPKSEEHKKSLKKAFNKKEYVEQKQKEMSERLKNGTFNISSIVEEEFIKKCIEPLGISFETQYYLKDLHHYCDVYIPFKNIIIEFQGDYWHGNPKKYTKEMLSEYQLKKVEKDNELRAYCKENNIRLIEIWESDYNKDVSNVIKTIKGVINE